MDRNKSLNLQLEILLLRANFLALCSFPLKMLTSKYNLLIDYPIYE